MTDVKTILSLFVGEMEKELKANEHKGEWRNWKDSTEIENELKHHFNKLKIAMYDNDTVAIKEHIADCGNILMMLGNAYNLYEPTNTQKDFLHTCIECGSFIFTADGSRCISCNHPHTK